MKPPLRILVTETIDPDGAMVRWASPDLSGLGHVVLPLPTQEAAPVLGAHGLAAWLLAIGESFRPDLVLVCPPYDHAPASTWRALRSLGARVAAFCFDEPLYAGARARPEVRDAYHEVLAAFDRVYVTSPHHAFSLLNAGIAARHLRWAMSPLALAPGPLPVSLAESLQRAVVFVGRAYERRLQLALELAQAGFPVHVFGHGWPRNPALVVHGPLEGPTMAAVLQTAGVVVTTGDWEAEPIPMVKVRLLEAALCGATQVAQEAPDLDGYFTADEVPRYGDTATLVAACHRLLADPSAALATASRAKTRALAEHTWTHRFQELALDLDLPGVSTGARPAFTPPAAYTAVIAALAADAERRGALRLAASCHGLSGDAFGLARVLAASDPTAAAANAARALAQRRADPATTVGIYARVPTPAPALGKVGFLDPSPELLATRLAALLAARDFPAASDLVSDLVADADLLTATAAILQADEDPTHRQVWQALFSSALGARPVDPVHQVAHKSRWEAELLELDALQRARTRRRTMTSPF
ncbi:MAG: glycosyltransferase [Deltaproteobacteria bacterium]|nr:glycosyltransferase [Deltaproteobacteria bacterium]